MNEIKPTFDFYDKTYLKSYNLDESLRYQMNLLDSLDVYTRKHCENVATIVCNLCRKLHLSREFTEYCIICAYLHDIGKLYIPPEILQKPSKLTDEEYEVMKKHTTLGYNICIKDPKLRPYHAGAYYHHECLDGTGYPQGLVKKDIPFEAQIIKVADEYEAIVNKRQYKTHIGISDALKIVIDHTKPTKSDALKILIHHTKPSEDAPKNTRYSKAGKNNKDVVNKLLKVVIDDIEYELSCVMYYVDALKKDLKRFKKLFHYYNKRNSAKTEEKKIYFEEYMKLYMKPHESIETFEQIYKELYSTYLLKKEEVKNLYNEIKIIKRLHV